MNSGCVICIYVDDYSLPKIATMQDPVLLKKGVTGPKRPDGKLRR